MKINKKEIKILEEYGYRKKDIQQIQNLKYKLILVNHKTKKERKISIKESKEKLGTGFFLSGIARAAFHSTAYRNINDIEGVYIESNLF